MDGLEFLSLDYRGLFLSSGSAPLLAIFPYEALSFFIFAFLCAFFKLSFLCLAIFCSPHNNAYYGIPQVTYIFCRLQTFSFLCLSFDTITSEYYEDYVQF